MAEESEAQKDIFGNPWSPPRDPRGRKRHARSAEVAEKVGVLRANGHTQEQIAIYLGLSEPTLRKYYFRELDVGVDLAKAELNAMIWEKAKAGSVPAMRLARDLLEKAEGALPMVPLSQGPAPARSPAKGKKEEAAEAALTAGQDSEWGDDLRVH